MRFHVERDERPTRAYKIAHGAAHLERLPQAERDRLGADAVRFGIDARVIAYERYGPSIEAPRMDSTR